MLELNVAHNVYDYINIEVNNLAVNNGMTNKHRLNSCYQISRNGQLTVCEFSFVLTI
jgi:hypothetical protein